MGITKIQVLKKRHFHLSALGIEAASFWSFVTTDNGQQTTDNGIFLSEEKTKSGKRYSGKPDGLPERPKKC